MEINSNSCCNSKMGMNGMSDALKPQQGQGMGKMKGGSPRSDADISSLGMMMQRPPNLSATGQSEMQDFRKQVMETSRTGEFNAEKLAEQAPDELKSYAAEMGVELTDMLTQLNEKMGQHQGMGAMQGGGMQHGKNQSNGAEQEDLISTLMDTLFGEDDSESEPEFEVI